MEIGDTNVEKTESDDTTSNRWTPEISMQMKYPSQVRASPDGKRVAYVVSEFIMTAEKSEKISQIFLRDLEKEESYQITYGEKSAQDPKWSPDGSRLAFTSNRKDKSNLYLLNLAGGEAEPLTDVKSDIKGFSWAPDGERILFLMADGQSEEEEKAAKCKDDAYWVDENHKPNHLYLLHLKNKDKNRSEPIRVDKQNDHVTDFDWSPDGKRIAFAHQPTPLANDWTLGKVSILNLETDELQPALETEAAVTQPRFSPDGSQLAVTVADLPMHWAFAGTIHVVSQEGSKIQSLPATYDSRPELIGWTADSRSLLYWEPKGTTTHLSTFEIETGVVSDLTSDGGTYLEFALNQQRTHVGLVYTDSDLAPEAYLASLSDFTPLAVSQINKGLSAAPLGSTEVIRWKSLDGKEIEGLLTYPAGYEAGTRVPLLLVIHGGPAGVFLQSFIGGPSIYPLASFASNGYALLRCNPRGSSGYGKAFRYANHNDWGGGDYEDLMAGVDHVIEMGIADAERLGVMGWSYGGFMTSWIITHTRRFKAASVGAAVTNLISFTGTADIPDFIPSYFDGYFWERRAAYERHSPMLYVDAVTTPTLIQHGDSDIRVPISQGYELYNALKALKVPTRMLVLPRQPHGPEEPRMLLKAIQSNLEWFEKHLK